MATRVPAQRLDSELMEAVLQAAEVARLGLTISSNTITDTGATLERIYVSETAATILGYDDPNELVGKPLFLTTPPEEHERLQEWVQRWYAGESVPRFVETVALRKDGSRVPIEVAFSTVPRDDRVLSVAFLRDVTERKNAELALLESEARVRQIIEAAPDAIVVLHDGILNFVNPAFLRILGYQKTDDVLGTPIMDIVHPADRATVIERLAELVRTGQSLSPYEYRATRRDGQTVVVEVLSFPFQFDGKACILSFARDMTERKHLQARLFQSDRMATMGTVAAGVAHEINNPLSYALLNLDLLDRQLPSVTADPVLREQLMATLGAIREGSQRVAAIVRDLRSFSRDSADDGELVDVEQILDSSINIAMSEIRGRARLVRAYESVPHVRASPARLGQVFLNLLLNASHALAEGRPEKNELSVAVRAIAGEDGETAKVCIEVKDNGPGIAPEILDRVFEPFFTTKPAGVGTGLGLAICQNIVTSLKGELLVHNVPGHGATFEVLLPAASARAPIASERRPTRGNGAGRSSVPAPAAAPVHSDRRPRVLVIDDELALARAIGRALAAEYEVEVAASASEAFLRLAQTPVIDVILCDVVMPGVDGIDFFRELKRTAPDLASRLIFMTGASAMPRVEEFLAGVPNAALDKPLDLDRLRKVLAETCRNSFAGVPCVNY